MKNKPSNGNSTNSIWKLFTSVRLTVFLLLTLAAVSIFGTLIPQNQNPAEYVRAFGPALYRLMDTLDLFDMYHSAWFRLLMLLLFFNVLACTIDRFPIAWKIVRSGNKGDNPERFRKSANRLTFTTTITPEKLQGKFEPVLAKVCRKVRVAESDQGVTLSGEKSRWSRLGVYVVHFSVILLLVGGFVGSWFGFDGFVNIPEGETVQSVRLMGTNEIMPLGFSIRCDDFYVEFYPNGTPKVFRSSLVIIENEQEVVTKDIIVNDPLEYRGIRIYQSSYGQMRPEPRQMVTTPTPPETPKSASGDMHFNITNRETGMIYIKPVEIGTPIDLPEERGKLLITEQRANADFGGMAIGEALVGILTLAGGDPTEIMLPLRFPNFDKMRGGTLVIAVHEHGPEAHEAHMANTTPPAEPRYYTGLQVNRDPGIWLVYAGFILMIVGCYVTFFMSHRQYYVELARKGKKTEVLVSGTTNKHRSALQGTLQQLADTLQQTAKG